MKNFTHLILSDGGVKGLSYIGVLQYMYIENMIQNLKHIAGTSIGAYFALIFALKIPLEEIHHQFYQIIQDIHNERSATITYETCNGLFFKKGMLSVDFVFKYIVQYIYDRYECCDMTFIEFTKRCGVNLHISATNIHSGKMQIFSLENTPNTSVLNAVKASMSIPFLFEPIEIDGELYNDGCISSSLSSNNIFVDIPRDQKLEIYLSPDLVVEEDCDILNEDITMFGMRIFQTLYKSHFNKQCPEKSNQNVLNFTNIPCNFMNFKITNDKICIDVCEEDYDRLVLYGFSEFSNYVNNDIQKKV